MLRKQKQSRTRRNVVVALIVIVLVAGAGVFALGHNKHWWDGKNTAATTVKTTAQVQTRPATSEGKKFDVPADLPQDAVKDYVLVNETDEYKIRQVPGTSNYIITLYAIINHPDQYSMYQDQLKEYKQKALDYLKGTGVDTSKATITYEPQEATNL